MKQIANLNVTGYAFSFNSLTMLSIMPSAVQAQLSCSEIECKGFAWFSARVGAPALRTSWA